MKREIIIVTVFWLLYGSVSFAIWHQTSALLLNLVAILGAGIFFTATFFAGSLLLRNFRNNRKKQEYKELVEEKMKTLDELKQEDENLLTNVFKENFGSENKLTRRSIQ